MEVHHHPDLHHKKKKFKEYFLEFLMIFLAVSLGFFAESLREYLGDNKRETEYIQSFISNLKQDTAQLKSAIAENQTKKAGLDSLVMLALKNINDPEVRKELYRLSGRYTSFYSAFGSNDATMMQLKNSGGMRYLRHSHVADSIATYDLQMRGIYAAETPYAKSISNAMEATQELMVYALRRDTTYFRNGTFTGKTLPLLSQDPYKVQVFFNKIADEAGWTGNYVQNLQERLPVAIGLIDFLQKEYGQE